MIEFSMTELILFSAAGLRRSSTEAPEIIDTYPGTSGNTQGDRNEISPATKAAKVKGKLCISIILLNKVCQLQQFNACFGGHKVTRFGTAPAQRFGVVQALAMTSS